MGGRNYLPASRRRQRKMERRWIHSGELTAPDGAMVSAIGLARLGDNSLRAGLRVSGRKISFPELLFAKAGRPRDQRRPIVAPSLDAWSTTVAIAAGRETNWRREIRRARADGSLRSRRRRESERPPLRWPRHRPQTAPRKRARMSAPLQKVKRILDADRGSICEPIDSGSFGP
jgi:hypothetical protein